MDGLLEYCGWMLGWWRGSEEGVEERIGWEDTDEVMD